MTKKKAHNKKINLIRRQNLRKRPSQMMKRKMVIRNKMTEMIIQVKISLIH